MIQTSLPLTAAFIEIPLMPTTGLAASLMFPASETGTYRWKTYKQRGKNSLQTKEEAKLLKELVLLSTQEQSASPATECYMWGEGWEI